MNHIVMSHRAVQLHRDNSSDAHEAALFSKWLTAFPAQLADFMS